MAYQSLYRRFRPQRFAEVKGQPHLISALQNAVREDRVAHAYLLSGPRGTGKTSTARLLAKALNCNDLGADGEPCTICDSCVAIENGTSMDLFELDAASNNGVDDVRDLLTKVALGTPGRRKVYILDEVHMFSASASNALLKTLEEPPDHVVFVLATTLPRKVLATIRSRTQHIELSLVDATTMTDHVLEIAKLAELDLSSETIEYVVARGGGSVRDTLSMLDQVLAAGGVGGHQLPLDAVVRALVDRDAGGALTAVAEAVAAGADSRDLAEQLTRHLRDMFLVQQDAPPAQLPADLVAALAEQGRALGPAATVRALEQLGTALVDMRQAADIRLALEVTLVRLTSLDSASRYDDLAERVKRLEASLAGGPGPTGDEPRSKSTPVDSSSTRRKNSPVAAARNELAKAMETGPSMAAGPELSTPTSPAPGSSAPPPPPSHPVIATDSVAPPTLETENEQRESRTPPISADIVAAWSAHIRPELTTRASVRFQAGEFVDVEPGVINYVLPNVHYRDRCLEVCADVVAAIESHFGAKIAIDVTLGEPTPEPTETHGALTSEDLPDADLPTIDVDDLTDAPAAALSGTEKLQAVFPGASIVEPDGTS